MKSSLLLVLTLTAVAAQAQVIKGARNYTTRIAPQAPPAQAYRPGPGVAPAAGAAVGSRSALPTAAQKDAADQKLLDYQKMRAEKGSESAQYELGMRFLNGKGVEADPAKAKEWFEKSAKGGNTQAKKQLDLLNAEPKNTGLTNPLKSAIPPAVAAPAKVATPDSAPTPNVPKK